MVLGRAGFGDVDLEVSRGLRDGFTAIHKFGENPDVAVSSTEDIWFGGGSYAGWITAADEVRIKAGGNAADDSGGAGAQSIVVEGLDGNWADASETIVTNGANVSTKTTTAFFRVFRAYVANVGTYGGANTGNITIETEAGTVVAIIPAGKGQTQMSMYTVPAGKTAYLQQLFATVAAAKAADIELFQRQNADDVSTPFTSKRLVEAFIGITSEGVIRYKAMPSFPAKTDLWAVATTGTGAAASVVISYDLILVDN